MQQSENVESVHNQAGYAPSSFMDIEDDSLRHKNQGAILANIFERYVDQASGCLKPKDFKMCTADLDAYLSRIPKKERRLATDEMMVHLDKRGYRIAK